MRDREAMIGVKIADLGGCVDAKWFVMNVPEEVMWGTLLWSLI